MPAVAMTDHGNLFGAVEFYNEAKGEGIHPVIGCEVYVSQQGHKSTTPTATTTWCCSAKTRRATAT
jgi:DNA polymerase III subunit alpha